MLKSLKTTRKRLAEKLSGNVSSSSCSSASSNDEPVSRQPSVGHEYVHQSRGHVKAHGDAAPRVSWSSAGYQAKTPFGDINILQADKQHILAAVMTCQPSSQGGRYLQRMLVRELQVQIRKQGGDVRAAIPASLQALDFAYKDLHPFNGPVLEGVSLALAYTDLKSQALHTASNGGCRIVVGRRKSDGDVHVVVDLGRSTSAERYSEEAEQAPSSSGGSAVDNNNPLQSVRYATVQLRPGMDTVILGSTGLWHEVPGQKALLRLQHYHDEIPSANGGNAAAHLTNFALHAVAQRSSRLTDPRMRSLKSVGHLQSLWTGDKSVYRWGRRQPVRRRRGDVHGDLSAVVLRLDWPGVSSQGLAASSGKSNSLGLLLRSHKRPCPVRASERAARHWDLLRMHFLHYPLASRRATERKWAELIEFAAEQASEQRHRRKAAEILLRRGLFGEKGTTPASRTGSGVSSPSGWRPAGWDTLPAETLGAQNPGRKGDDVSGMGQPLVSDSVSSSLSVPLSSLGLGQLLQQSSPSVSRFSSLSSSSSESSWQPQQQPQPRMIPRTVSRRQLFVPPPPQQLPHVLEGPDSDDGEPVLSAATAFKDLQPPSSTAGESQLNERRGTGLQDIKHEWQAYEQHVAAKKPSLDLGDSKSAE